jgi:deazaflavin-dependent oxidoreductase (nitroreductase family)
MVWEGKAGGRGQPEACEGGRVNHRFPAASAEDDYCYLITAGRKTGLPRTTEIWFALDTDTLYVMAGSGERAYWVRNLRANPELSIRIGSETLPCMARDVRDGNEDALARKLLVDKYQPRYSGDLSGWGATSLPLAFEVSTYNLKDSDRVGGGFSE